MSYHLKLIKNPHSSSQVKSGTHHGQLGTGQPIGEEPMAQVLGQVDNLGPLNLPLIPIRFIQVDRYELVADLGSEFAIIHLSVRGDRLERVILITLLLQLHFVVVLSVELFAFVLGPLLPPVLVEAIGEHQDKLHYLAIVCLTDHL